MTSAAVEPPTRRSSATSGGDGAAEGGTAEDPRPLLALADLGAPRGLAPHGRWLLPVRFFRDARDHRHHAPMGLPRLASVGDRVSASGEVLLARLIALQPLRNRLVDTRQLLLNGGPHEVCINAKILVDEDIPHSGLASLSTRARIRSRRPLAVTTSTRQPSTRSTARTALPRQQGSLTPKVGSRANTETAARWIGRALGGQVPGVPPSSVSGRPRRRPGKGNQIPAQGKAAEADALGNEAPHPTPFPFRFGAPDTRHTGREEKEFLFGTPLRAARRLPWAVVSRCARRTTTRTDSRRAVSVGRHLDILQTWRIRSRQGWRLFGGAFCSAVHASST